MKKGQKLYYVDISGNMYTYIITEITEDKVILAWEEDASVSLTLSHEEAERIAKKYATIESAKEEAEKRKTMTTVCGGLM